MLCSSPTKPTDFLGFIFTIDFFQQQQKPKQNLGLLHDKFQKPETIQDLFPKVFNRKGLKNG